jgi:hypothetical protein
MAADIIVEAMPGTLPNVDEGAEKVAPRPTSTFHALSL